MHRSRTLAITILVALTMALAACSGGGSSPSTAPESVGGGGDTGETVSLAGGQFTPGTLTIAAGTTVTFTDGSGHTVTEGSDGEPVDDPIVDEEWSGEPIEVTFDEPGTYEFTCRIHPAMTLTVTVEG